MRDWDPLVMVGPAPVAAKESVLGVPYSSGSVVNSSG